MSLIQSVIMLSWTGLIITTPLILLLSTRKGFTLTLMLGLFLSAWLSGYVKGLLDGKYHSEVPHT